MYNPEPSSANHRLLDNNDRLKQSRPPVPSVHSMPSALYSGDASGNKSRRMTRTRSSPAPLQYEDEEEEGRDSHDLSISPRAFGRESLVDNLLLSFDKFGNGDLGFDSFFPGNDAYDDDDAATISSHQSHKTGYSARGRRSNSSSNYHSHLGRLPPHPGMRQFGSMDYGSMPTGFGATYNRENLSRSGLASTSQLATYTTEEYDAAPTPTVHSGPRERSVTLEGVPKLERRNSNKSNRSLRRPPELPFAEPMTLPPLPAFHTPTPAPVTPVKQTSRPGFFKRVFGGGNSNSKSTQSADVSKDIVPVSQQQQHQLHQQQQQQLNQQTPTPQSVVNKKPSFFRRRKKSVSEPPTQPALPHPVQTLRDIDPAEPSPVSSLRAVMNPYLRTPIKPIQFQSDIERDTAYLQRNATIRTVASSDPSSPPRPTYFGESRVRRDSEIHFAASSSSITKVASPYSREPKFARGSSQELGLPIPPKSPKSFRDDRPQTSPNSPLPLDDNERDLHWPPALRPLSMRRSLDTLAFESEREKENMMDRDRELELKRQKEIEKARPIATFQEIELQHAREQKRRESRGGGPLNLDVSVGGTSEFSKAESSWLATPTPLSAATSLAPTVVLQIRSSKGDDTDDASGTIASEEVLEDQEATENEKEFVRKIFEGDEEFISKARAAAWLGASGPEGERARRAYMAMFDFSNMNILSAVRMLCHKLVLKGETQQVDRIVDAFSKRWCECNPNHGFKSADIVHTILYSLLLLNTDLHMVDVPNSQRMTRGQFLKNTMSTIRRGLADTPGTPLEARPAHHNTLPARGQASFRAEDSPIAGAIAASTFPLIGRDRRHAEGRTSLDLGRGGARSKTGGIGNLSPRLPDDNSPDYDIDGGLALVNVPILGGIRLWETQVEIILKDFYSSVKACALPLHGASREKVDNNTNNGSLSVFGSNMLRRSPSTISKATSEHSVSHRNDLSNRLGTKWTAKNRSRPKLYNGSYAGSSRTSLEDRSLWSPSASSTWSKYSLDRTQTSMSVTSLGSAFGHGDYQQSIGFANALSHAIIREEASATTADEVSAHFEDDGLELAGAPWAKEGMIKHKHHLESMDKKAKNRGWTECFAVIERGSMKMFQFNMEKSGNSGSGGVVGGGNWTKNAQPVGSFLLRQTIASALPPPGYSKTRPYVWALSLPSGAVHLFQGGTAEIVREWVSTANYWSARLSKEPLVGGVSNVEYGWGDCIVDIDTASTTATFGPRPSLQESIRSSIDHGSVVRPRLPGDKITIAEWTPPGQSMMASPLSEADQLKALETYVANIEAELTRHNELRNAVALAFSPRHPNSGKALANWERKSSYLLREIVKFRTYIDCLAAATALRERMKEQEKSPDSASINMA